MDIVIVILTVCRLRLVSSAADVPSQGCYAEI